MRGKWQAGYILDEGEGTKYLLIRDDGKFAQECDGCGKRTNRGWRMYRIEGDKIVPTGTFSCSLGCAQSNADAEA